MTTTENIFLTVLVLLAPIGLFYGWFFYFTGMRHEALGLRSGITLTSLGLVSFTILLWMVRGMLFPKADWVSGAGVAHQVHWAETWERVALRLIVVALVLAPFGRPRLILPIVLACLGTALFWVFTTMP